ncbi:MAG TPA: CPBP family intramembrane glutamic endopeptidase, partial [Candidatus Acidoferrum sp.]|nr:CPBP family intramembrane glutamic endopeptidase [Candidatus Acidoferrum sp.]
VSVHEELTFRGYLLFIAARRIRFWRAAIALSIGFAAAHLPNPGETFFGILQVLGTGLLFCFMIRRTGNLWFVLGFHAAWDWAQTFFYGTADSGLKSVGYFLNTSTEGPRWLTGGSTGPEGSVLSLIILLLAALLMHFRFPKALYPDRPA